MRAEVALIQRRLGVATIYVTHDQVEAMTMGDRVAVMRGGVLQQCEQPQRLYDNPTNLFVAAFIGSPAMNLFEGSLAAGASAVRIGSQEIALGDGVHAACPGLRRYANRTVTVGIRSEDLALADEQAAANGHSGILAGSVELVEALGSELLVHFSIDARRIEADGVEEADAAGLAAGTLAVRRRAVARVPPRLPVTAGGTARFRLDPLRLHFFDPDSELAIGI
jgi:multiple sugar transport system ATP-binding protein